VIKSWRISLRDFSSMRRFQFYFISTPIGNLDDFSKRSVETLGSVDFVLAEDTRKAKILFRRYGISAKPWSFHDHNKEKVAPAVMERIANGERGALIADAGTPAISDPGYYLIRLFIQGEVEFTILPGPSAVIAALVLSGLPTDRFTFYGYMPRKKGKKESVLCEVAENRGTSIFFESPYRLIKTLQLAKKVLPQREMVVSREITKIHEDVARGNADELLNHFKTKGVKGEITLMIRGKGKGNS
jgi:16S rRNA (cytidine1402-2'-O)-methyltransferase